MIDFKLVHLNNNNFIEQLGEICIIFLSEYRNIFSSQILLQFGKKNVPVDICFFTMPQHIGNVADVFTPDIKTLI